MAKTDATGRSKSGLKHVRLHRWLMKSAAWKSLRLGARCLLIELYDTYDGSNNGSLFLSVRKAAQRLRVSKNTALALFNELEDRGFIRANERGVFTTRRATTWILTEFHYADRLPTKDFMAWRPSDGRKKQKIVSLSGTNGTSQGDQGPDFGPQKSPNGTCERDQNADSEGSMVPLRGTQVVNQGEDVSDDVENRLKKGPEASARFSPALPSDDATAEGTAGGGAPNATLGQSVPSTARPSPDDINALLEIPEFLDRRNGTGGDARPCRKYPAPSDKHDRHAHPRYPGDQASRQNRG
jgi:hypothetical protein